MLGAMNLTEHILAQGGTAKASCPVIALIAGLAGCSASTLYMIAGGHKKPSAILAGAIADATGGAVTRQDLRPDVFGQPDSEAA
jgi:DNA-binding transcriptional regulator YdaS (Cro superfamily)